MGVRITRKQLLHNMAGTGGVIGIGIQGYKGISINKRVRKPDQVDKVVRKLLHRKKHPKKVISKMYTAMPSCK